jgi:iron complex transport system ATP-binding protein
MDKVIEFQNVSWRRQKRKILKNINWQVEKGQHWAVFGLNGSGKTTLLNMVNGYIWPSTGEVTVLDQSFGKTDIRELRKSIGWVSSSLQERMNGRQLTQDIVVSGKYASIGLYEEPSEMDFKKAFEIMARLNGKHLIDRTYETCSSGEKQRILIARGLMASPKLLILDEPSSGLDFIAREELLTTINELARQESAPTIILVTHHIEEVLPEFSHALLLQNGRVFEQGRREDIFNSESLSKFFEKSVQVEWHNDRAWMSLLE